MRSCTLWLASRQVRIHRASGSRLHLRVASGPIIEHCTTLGFGPCPALAYPGAAEDLEAAQLAEDRGLWRQVQDFGWLRSTPSPAWRALSAVMPTLSGA